MFAIPARKGRVVLESTFRHIPGIGPKTEQRLWARGWHSWQTVRDQVSGPLSPAKTEWLRSQLRESRERLEDQDAAYFSQRLPASEHWRLFPEFRHTAAFLDIETTGLGGPDDYITTIVLYDGHSLRHYVHDDNLWTFRDDIEPYQLLITYNGKCFDAPFIHHHLGISLPPAHIDLRYVLASLGYRGGLKGCERQCGIDRGELEDLDGYFAVLLWFDYYHRGNPRALETLLAYNALDVVNLETLMIRAYNLKIRQTPFCESHHLSHPSLPELPFRADRETIRRLRWEHGW